MSRSVPWRTVCPPGIKGIFEQLPSCQLLLVKRTGPTSFLLSRRNGRAKFKTSIGDPHSCSCTASDELCVHVIFVLCRVFFLPQENPLVWQRALVEAEIDELLKAESRLKNTWRQTQVVSVAARPVEQGDVCPICFEELGTDTQLDFCLGGCGKHIHSHCFKQYRHHNAVGPLRCPYCRIIWQGTASSTSKKCSGCQKYAVGECYRCLFCQDYFLCAHCFHRSSAHSNHPFSLMGTREVAERRNERSVSSTQTGNETLSRVPQDVLPLMYREINPNDYELLLRLDEDNHTRKLTPNEFLSLQKKIWTTELGAETCNICLDAFDATSCCVILDCGHFFHSSCAKTWLTEHAAKCPLDHIPVVVQNSKAGEGRSGTGILPPLITEGIRRSDDNRRVPRRLRHTTAHHSTYHRQETSHLRQRIEGVRATSAAILPDLELHAVALGFAQRPRRSMDRFLYGTM
ncbi:hypothetical protein TRVL_05013 [Trypanosoma vivax]|nr:hypothetical protein TRVL_05013 [Trypanosoma vivax]